MSTPCPLKFPAGWPQSAQDAFCKLWESKIYSPETPYEVLSDAVKPGTDKTVPLSFVMDFNTYTYHPTEFWAGGKFLGNIGQFGGGKTIGVTRVESVGNGDQGSWDYEQAQYGNLYLVTQPGPCESDRSYAIPAMPNFRDGPNTDHFLGYLVKLCGGQRTLPRDISRTPPLTVQEAKEKLSAAIVTVLPGPFGTHAPDDPESIARGYTMKQGEFGIAWQSISYMLGKPSIPLDAPNLPTPLRGAKAYCSKVMQSNGRKNEIIQFTWTPAEVIQAGGLTVAHDFLHLGEVLRGKAAEATPSLFKMTLGLMPARP